MISSNEIIDKLTRIKESKRWSNYRIAKESKLPASTVANIFNRTAVPQIDTLLAVCSGLGIDVAQLFGNEKYSGLSPSEMEIISLWESLDDNRKDAVRTIIKLLNE